MCMHWFNSQINKEKKIIFCINLQTKKKMKNYVIKIEIMKQRLDH